jgi:hypothetical protein
MATGEMPINKGAFLIKRLPKVINPLLQITGF